MNRIKYLSINLAIFVVLAVLVFVFKEAFVKDLKYYIGGLMLLYAVSEEINLVAFERHIMFREGKFYLSVVELILGICLIVTPISYEATCVVWATWSIMREAYEIKEIVCDLRSITPRILSGVESIVCIVFSVLLIIEPGEHHAMIHMYLLIVELLLTSLVPLLDEVIQLRFYKKNIEEKE